MHGLGLLFMTVLRLRCKHFVDAPCLDDVRLRLRNATSGGLFFAVRGTTDANDSLSRTGLQGLCGLADFDKVAATLRDMLRPEGVSWGGWPIHCTLDKHRASGALPVMHAVMIHLVIECMIGRYANTGAAF